MPDLLLRREDGQPIREAMEAAGMGAPAVAAATRRHDHTGRGVSTATVGRLAGTGSSAREVARLKTAWLIAEALDRPLQKLFSLPSVSTSTVERSTPHGDEVDR